MSTARTGRSTKLLVMQRDEMVKTTAVDVQRLGRQHLLGLPGGPSTGVQTHQCTRSHENGARGHPIRSPPLGMAAGCSAPFPNLKATDRARPTHRRQQQRGAGGAAAAGGTSSATGNAWSTEKKEESVRQHPPLPTAAPFWMGARGKAKPSRASAQDAHPTHAGLCGAAPLRGPAGFPQRFPHPGTPPPRSPGEGDAARAGTRTGEAVPGSCQPGEQPSHEPNCRERNGASGGGPAEMCPPSPRMVPQQG